MGDRRASHWRPKGEPLATQGRAIGDPRASHWRPKGEPLATQGRAIGNPKASHWRPKGKPLATEGRALSTKSFMGQVFSKLRLQTAKKTDERVRLMSEILDAMRVIKMYTWESHFSEAVQKARREEIKIVKKISTLRGINMGLYYSSSKLILMCTFLVFVVTGNQLKADVVFLSVALFNNIRLVMTFFFPFGVTQAAETLISVQRLQEFLLLEEHVQVKALPEKVSQNQGKLELNHASAGWLPESTHPAIDNLSVTIQPGQLVVVLGPVGSGKSSLLQAMLGELPLEKGTLEVGGQISYAGQEPWVFGGTLRNNILLGLPFNDSKYKQVLKACALSTDVENFPFGDYTLVGDRGVTLSGGQKARLSLARTMYQDADIYVLDDPLSAVDARVGRHVFKECIKGYLKQKTRILVTHQIQFINEADYIIVMNQVKTFPHARKFRKCRFLDQLVFQLPSDICKIGFFAYIELDKKRGRQYTHEELQQSQLDVSAFARKDPSEEERVNDIIDPSLSMRGAKSIESLPSASGSLQFTQEATNAESFRTPTAPEEMRSQGAISWDVYTQFFKAGGNFVTLGTFIVSTVLGQVLFSGSDWWLAKWTDETQEKSLQRNLTSITAGGNSTEFSPEWFHTLTDVEFLYGYCCIVGILLLMSQLRSIGFFWICTRASVELHKRMFNSVLRAPIRFFDENPSGRLLNRFSRDTGNMDEALPFIAMDVNMIFFMVVGNVVLVSTVKIWIIGPTCIMLVGFILLRSYYMRTSREVKRLEGITSIYSNGYFFTARSPVFSLLSVSLQGLPTIRAAGSQVNFTTQFDDLQDSHSAAWFLFISCTRWFGLVLDWIIVAYVGIIVYSFAAVDTDMIISPQVSRRGSRVNEQTLQCLQQFNEILVYDEESELESQPRKPNPELDSQDTVSSYETLGGDVGLAISSAMMLTGMFQWGVRQSAELENQMTSVERVLEYTKLEPEARLESEEGMNTQISTRFLGFFSRFTHFLQGLKPSDVWPHEGKIDFLNVSMKYSPDQPAILKNLNFSIKPGEKVGVCGRTGAGKSSLISALYRLTEPQGCIMIDGVETKSLGLHDLRKQISIIPQDPVLFQGTMRRNLDPFQQYNDVDLWDSLAQVQLKEKVSSLSGGLDTEVSEGGKNFSVGERQLVCLARAILKKTKILVMDEATANVDQRTDSAIQTTIRKTFLDCTVITIAHRLETIIDSDRVLVLDSGNVVEFDTPHQLLQKDASAFLGLAKQSGHFEKLRFLSKTVQKSGGKEAQAETQDSGHVDIKNE
ncbi:unnamed protein product [Notodromas monacha]|uniref:Multidrug resistance-associated protein 4 n=1 Tax=Notodromas monacha TaxID=399045 RepID=A0A7R9G9P2_9CRUS|nr:unnamed protein product [Notodromas monacha]CAG0914467.1 unnamed protein product [Notodromas monacha]